MDWMNCLAVALLAFAATRVWMQRKPRQRARTVAENRNDWLINRHHWQGGN
jgi:hypothetical protein